MLRFSFLILLYLSLGDSRAMFSGNGDDEEALLAVLGSLRAAAATGVVIDHRDDASDRAAAAAASSAPLRPSSFEEAAAFVKGQSGALSDGWNHLRHYKPGSRYGGGALKIFYNAVLGCVKDLEIASSNYFRERDSLIGASMPGLASVISVGTENNHAEIQRVLQGHFLGLEPIFGEIIRKYKTGDLTPGSLTLLEKRAVSGGVSHQWLCFVDASGRYIPAFAQTQNGTGRVAHCLYSPFDNVFCFAPDGTVARGRVVKIHVATHDPFSATVYGYLGAGEGAQSFTQTNERAVFDPTTSLRATLEADMRGDEFMYFFPGSEIVADEDSIVVDLLLLDMLGEGERVKPLLLTAGDAHSEESAASVAGSTLLEADEGAAAASSARDEIQRLLDEQRHAIEQEWLSRQEWVARGAPLEVATKPHGKASRAHVKQRGRKASAAAASHNDEREAARAARKKEAHMQALSERINQGRVKYRSLISFLRFMRQEMGEGAFYTVLRGSHMVVHREGVADTVTLVRPHGTADRTLPRYRAQSLVRRLLDMYFAGKDSLSAAAAASS